MEVARKIFNGRLELHDDPYAALAGADGLLLVTEWLSYRSPDFDRIQESLRTKVLFDGRNIWRRIFVEQTGLTYYGIGV
jgi:UDPglucose 6-dehydrogenase